MFERIRSFLSNLGGVPADSGPSPENEVQVAVAALMFHVMEADGVRDAAEGERLRQLLGRAYGLETEVLERVAAAGEEADREAIDLYAFTSIIKRGVDYDGRVELIRLLWELVYADGERHELEDNLLWRIAELLGVEARERILARSEVAGRSSE